MSTDAVCGHGDRSNRIFTQATAPKPYKHYGRSKYLAERYILSKVQQGHLDATVLRGFWFFGPFAPPRQLDFVKMFRWPRQVVFGNGTNLRTISHVDNTISAFIEAEQCTATFGKSYWIGGAEQPHTVNEIYAAIAQQLGVPFRPLYVPIAFCKLFGLADTLLAIAGRLHPTIHAAGKFYFDIAGEIEAARRDFGYEPKVTFAMAIKELAKAAT
jgi:nucleoside-diphosphate-sugar epimerase